MRRTAPSPAFTLIESIVVIVILAVSAGLIVPRMIDRDSRRAELEARSMRDLLSVAARRLAAATSQLAIDGDASGARVLVLGSPQEYDPFSSRRPWRLDPLVPPVVLEWTRVGQVIVDGVELPPGSWRINLDPASTPVTVAMLLSAERRAWRIDLSPDSTAASLAAVAPGVRLDPLPPQWVDLDAIGREDDPW